MKRILLYSAFFLFPAITFAGNQNDGNRKGPVSEYVKQHVTPVITAKRQAFDALLSETEKNELASIREELQQLRQNRRAAMQSRSEEMSDNAASPNVQNESRSGNHAKMKELMEQVKIIAERHSDQLDKINNELAPKKAQWKNDIARIVASKQNTKERSASSFSGNDYYHYGMGGRNKMWNRTGFLLMNPSAPGTSDNEKQASIGSDVPASSTMSVFPNPAANQFSLNLSGLPAENKLTVTDMTGKVIVEKENLMSSENETVSCNDLSNGVYFVRLSTPDQTINQKLIISH